jgi:hypothetical protein
MTYNQHAAHTIRAIDPDNPGLPGVIWRTARTRMRFCSEILLWRSFPWGGYSESREFPGILRNSYGGRRYSGKAGEDGLSAKPDDGEQRGIAGIYFIRINAC